MTGNAFDKLLLEAVDSALSSLGESAKQSVYFHLEKKFDMTRDKIPNQVEDFDRSLEMIFGEGARFLEILVMKKLFEEIGSTGKMLRLFPNKEFKFVDYVKAAERAYSQSKKT